MTCSLVVWNMALLLKSQAKFQKVSEQSKQLSYRQSLSRSSVNVMRYVIWNNLYLLIPETYPLQKKEQSHEFLRQFYHLRSRTDQNAALMRLRGNAMQAIYGFFKVRIRRSWLMSDALETRFPPGHHSTAHINRLRRRRGSLSGKACFVRTFN